jgi:hypothetical protein
MADTTKAYVLADVILRVGYYALAASVFVFVAMLVLAGVHPW